MDVTFVVISVLLVITDGLTVRGPSAPLVAPLGSSVVLSCYVDEPLPMEGLEVEWRRTDSETLVHLYQNGESRPESQQQDYHDRAHFFTDQIQHGNFSLRLDNLRAKDKGKYTCTVYSQQDSGEIEVQIKDVERLLVSGSSRSISASVGEDITLNCSVDSHITPEHIEELLWKKTDEDDIPVLLYQNNKTFPEAAHERYRDRVEFFTDEIPKGNFSLRLKSVRTEDKGVYMCQVFTGGLSANATVVLERLGLSFSHIMVLILCFAASGSSLLLYIIIYCKLQNTDSTAAKRVRTLGFLQAILPNIMMFVAFVLWGVTEGFLYETISCCALYILRPLMVINVAPYLKKMSEFSLRSESVIFMLFYFSVLFSRAWGNIAHYEESERIMIIAAFGCAILLSVIFLIFFLGMKMPCQGEICEWINAKLFYVASFSFFILPSLQFGLMQFAFVAAREVFFVSMISPLFYILSFSCVVDINRERSFTNLLNVTSWMIVMFNMTAEVINFYIRALTNEKDAAGWTCTAVFGQVLWMMAVYTKVVVLALPFAVKQMLYVFGSVGVVLLNSAALMTELILKTVNGERAVGDLRVVVFSSESTFAFSLLILLMFKPWISEMKCWQSCQDAAASDEASACGSDPEQNMAESHEMSLLLNQDQEAGRRKRNRRHSV